MGRIKAALAAMLGDERRKIAWILAVAWVIGCMMSRYHAVHAGDGDALVTDGFTGATYFCNSLGCTRY